MAKKPIQLKNILNKYKNWFIKRILKKPDSTLRKTIEDLIEVHHSDDQDFAKDERLYLTNILKLNELRVYDLMIPRADITAIDVSETIEAIISKFIDSGHSRLPVYKKDLDDVLGFIHIRDLLQFIAKFPKSKRNKTELLKLIRKIMIIVPSMSVIDLIVKMQAERQHLALVVDEYGGIDGLITIEDLFEEIVGEIEDEHDNEEEHNYKLLTKNKMITDSRVEIEVFEKHFGAILSKEEKEDIDTIGGMIFALIGRIPARGEIISKEHTNALGKEYLFEFKIIDADSRKIKRIKITKRPIKKDILV